MGATFVLYAICPPFFKFTSLKWVDHVDSSLLSSSADSLSMLLATAFVLQRVLTFNKPLAYSRNVTLSIIVSLLTFTAYHVKYNDMNSHSIVFGIMIVVVGINTMSLVEIIKDEKVKRNVRMLGRVGAGESIYSWIFHSFPGVCGRLRIKQLVLSAGLFFGSLTTMHASHCGR